MELIHQQTIKTCEFSTLNNCGQSHVVDTKVRRCLFEDWKASSLYSSADSGLDISGSELDTCDSGLVAVGSEPHITDLGSDDSYIGLDDGSNYQHETPNVNLNEDLRYGAMNNTSAAWLDKKPQYFFENLLYDNEVISPVLTKSNQCTSKCDKNNEKQSILCERNHCVISSDINIDLTGDNSIPRSKCTSWAVPVSTSCLNSPENVVSPLLNVNMDIPLEQLVHNVRYNDLTEYTTDNNNGMHEDDEKTDVCNNCKVNRTKVPSPDNWVETGAYRKLGDASDNGDSNNTATNPPVDEGITTGPQEANSYENIYKNTGENRHFDESLHSELRNNLSSNDIENKSDSGYTSENSKFSSQSSRKKCQIKKLLQQKQKQQALILKRKQDLYNMIDGWYEQLDTQIEFIYEQEIDKLEKSETIHSSIDSHCGSEQLANSHSKMAANITSNSVICSVLNTERHIHKKEFGFLKYHISSGTKPPEDICAYELSNTATHIRTFESRDNGVETEYMATSLTVNEDGNYVICDLGADTCRIFSPQGKTVCDFDVYPLSEPSHVLPLKDGEYLVSCKDGLQLFNDKGELKEHHNHDTLATIDIKCPQSLATDREGNYLISDMHDCGSVLITLQQNSLTPIRLFSGSHFDDDSAEYFRNAWYIHVTKDNTVVLSDRENHCVKCYTRHGEFLWNIGKQGSSDGDFITPAGITEDELGNLIVADCGNDRVQLFTKDGEWLAEVVNNERHGILSPIDVGINKEGQLVVLQADGGVSVFEYLSQII